MRIRITTRPRAGTPAAKRGLRGLAGLALVMLAGSSLVGRGQPRPILAMSLPSTRASAHRPGARKIRRWVS